jgi:hypothetical protein
MTVDDVLDRAATVIGNNYITDKVKKHEDNSHKATFGNSTAEKQLFLPCTTKKIISVKRTGRKYP